MLHEFYDIIVTLCWHSYMDTNVILPFTYSKGTSSCPLVEQQLLLCKDHTKEIDEKQNLLVSSTKKNYENSKSDKMMSLWIPTTKGA